MLLYFIWSIALFYTIWTESYLTMSILIISGILIHFLLPIKKDNRSLIWTTMLLQLCWIFVAYFTNTPILVIGIILQYICTYFIYRELKTEQHSIELKYRDHFKEQTMLLDELRNQRHDLHKHLDVIRLSTRAGDSNLAEDILENYYKIDRIIKNENHVIAGLLYKYLKEADATGIELSYAIQHGISHLPFSPYDTVSLIGNILTNAIEAATLYQKETNKNTIIQFSCRKQSGIWIIVCQNPTLPIPDKILDTMYTRKSFTSKGEGHDGIGTKQIAKLTKSVQGTVNFTYTDELFTLKIKIPDVQTT